MDALYDVFKTGIAQTGAVGLLLWFAWQVIQALRKENAEKDLVIKAEVEKRESLLRETLAAHHAASVAMKDVIEGVSRAMDRIESVIDRIEGKIDAKPTK